MESALRPVPPGTRLIETFGWSPEHGIPALDLHLDRMARSAAEIGFAFDRSGALLAAGAIQGDAPLRCRMTLGDDGAFEVTSVSLPPSAAEWVVTISPVRLSADDVWLRHKTTNRALYDQTRASLSADVDEVIFLNTDGHLCEGTITNLFITTADGRRVTPAFSCGLLPGIYRQQELAAGRAQEAYITLEDLRQARAVTVGNALRGEIPVRLRL